MKYRTKNAISICTYCMGRGDVARKTIPCALSSMAEHDEMIVVDYSCPDHIGDWCKLQSPRIRVVAVRNVSHWHINHARNCGGVVAREDILLFIDVDVILTHDAIEEIRCLERGEYLRLSTVCGTHKHGSVALYKSDFMEVNGYEEALVGWGYDDVAFYDSINKYGLRSRIMRSAINVVEHGDNIRYRHCHSHNIINRKIYELLRSLHKYKNNVGRNWGRA